MLDLTIILAFGISYGFNKYLVLSFYTSVSIFFNVISRSKFFLEKRKDNIYAIP